MTALLSELYHFLTAQTEREAFTYVWNRHLKWWNGTATAERRSLKTQFRTHIRNLKPKPHPVEGVMMQPPRSTVILQPHPRSGVSWFMPKLCPSSCANVTAAPSGFSEWSFGGKQEGTLEHVNLSNICEPLFTHCENKPQWNAVKTLKKKTLSFPNSCRVSKQLCSAPSSIFYYPISFWKPDFICHSITPADPIRTAVRGDKPPYTHCCLTRCCSDKWGRGRLLWRERFSFIQI